MSFDQNIERRGTGSIKWDLRPELDPFWVADMDFQSPPDVIDALKSRVSHGVFGYAIPHDGLKEAVSNYLSTRHNFETDEKNIVHLGGLVPALSLAARAFGEKGDELVTCTPVYPPFLHVAHDGGLDTVKVPHLQVDGRWSFDWLGLEKAVSPRSKIFLLCNPQNPLGRCFTEEEITKIAEFCLEKGLICISDEVHCDLILEEEKTPFFSALNLPASLRENCIVLLSPSKTYNIAGMGYAYAVIENDDIRNRFTGAKGHTMPEINCLSFYAAEAAYRHGESWRKDLIACLRKNRDHLAKFVSTELTGIKIPEIEATYLAWMDCSSLDLKHPSRFFEETGLFLSNGSFFGSSQHVRFNFGCSEARVFEGLEKMKTALSL